MANSKKKNQRARKRFLPYQEHFHLHFSAVIFIVVFIYIVIIIVNYLTKEQTGIYEVVRGNNNASTSYTAFIFRNEQVYTSQYTGYVNYYIEPGDRIRKNSVIATMDEKGDFLKNIITESSAGSNLSTETLKRFKNSFADLITDFELNDYQKLYSSKNTINSELLTLLASEGMSKYFSSSNEYSFDIVTTPVSGIFANTCDGYENFNISDVSQSLFDTSEYAQKKTEVFSGQKTEAGSFLYKIIPADNFSIVFKMSDEDIVKYWETKKLTVYLPGADKELTGSFSFVFDAAGNRFARVDFSDYGFNLANTRYINIVLNDNAISGLEIPDTAIVTKDYYVIPLSYVNMGGNDKNAGVFLQVYENGELGSIYKSVTVVDQDDDCIYVDISEFNEGDCLIKSDSTDQFLIGAKKTETGVYSVNKGYAVFKPIEILYKLDEGYSIVREGVKTSISLYDRIALNAKLINEGELIY